MLKFKNTLVKLFLELFVFNKYKRSILKAKWAKYNLKKYVDLTVKNIQKSDCANDENEKIIWQYWHQGEDKAPKIIKKCLSSIKKHYPDYKINVLSFETIKDYINLPEKYYNLLENKKIPIALFSDVLRLYLLSEYGGMWIDSTMYATGKLPHEILESSFFMFQKNPEIDQMQNNNSCYFIKSNKGNIFLNVIKETIENYWNENDFVINYFLFEHIVTLLSKSNNALINEWNKMPCIYTNNVCAIQDKKFNKMDKTEFESIIKATSIHKLTYKTIPKNYNEKDTFLSKLLEI